jgi:hypothetical protein
LGISPCSRQGLPSSSVTAGQCGLLPRSFHLFLKLPRGSFVSVALSLGSPPVAVSDCHSLCCPDFPPSWTCVVQWRSADNLANYYYITLVMIDNSSIKWYYCLHIMFEHATNFLHDWYRNTSDRQKLQHFYVLLLCLSVIVAGIAALFKNNPSSLLVTFAAVIAVSFLTNLLAWSVLSTLILEKLRNQQRTNRTTQRTK